MFNQIYVSIFAPAFLTCHYCK